MCIIKQELTMKVLVILGLFLTGCSSIQKKTCYEMTVTLSTGATKQVICTNIPQTETANMRRIK